MTEDKKNENPVSDVNAKPSSVSRKRRWLRFWGLVALAVVATVFGLALLVNIFQRKQEARNPFFRVVELTDDTVDPAIWGKNFPLQYDDYLKTTDQVRTRYGGSEAEPRTPTQADPRSIVAQSKLEEDPRLKLMWAGYAFSKDFREERGHAYMLDDQTFTERQQVAKQPGTCINCHASVYVVYKQLGGGDIIQRLRTIEQDAILRSPKGGYPPGFLYRLPRFADDATASNPPCFHRGDARSQSFSGHSELRREQTGHSPGDAGVRLRSMPRRVSFQWSGKAARLPLGQRASSREHSRLLR